MAVPDILMWTTFALIVATVVGFALERQPIELVSLASLVGWLLLFWLVPLIGGVESPLSVDDLLAGFANPALITVLALLVVGQGLFHTDALDRPAAMIARYGGRSGMGAAIILLGAAMVASAFVNDTPIVVMFLPIVAAVAASRGIAPAKVMMPLSFAALLGGMTTLIGTSTNLLAAGVAAKSGLQIGIFEFTVPAALMAAVGFAYITLILPRLLPVRGGFGGEIGTSTGKQFIAQIDVGWGHRLAGATAIAGLFPALKDMTVRLVQRGDHAFLPPFDGVTLKPGDRVILAATRMAISKALADGSTSMTRDGGEAEDDQQTLSATDVTLAEVVVAPGSRVIGRTIEQAGLHHLAGVVVLGVERRSRMPRMPLTDIRLEAGDVLLVGGTQAEIERLRGNRDFLLLEWSASELPRRDLARRALLVFAVFLVYAASGVGPIVIGAIAAALAMILGGCLNIRQALRAFDQRIFLMIGASLAAATALEATGGAAYIADHAVGAMDGLPTPVVLSGIFAVVAIVTNFLSNNATAVLFTPIAINVAAKAGANPMPFVVAVILAANCSFATPIGYQTNLLVMGPGHYRFADYLKGGLPLVVLMWLVFSLIVPWLYAI